MRTDLNKTRSVEGEAKRGAHNARAFLAENPSQTEIWIAIQWSIDELSMHDDAPDSAGAAYARAHRDVLRYRLRDKAAARKAERSRPEGRNT